MTKPTPAQHNTQDKYPVFISMCFSIRNSSTEHHFTSLLTSHRDRIQYESRYRQQIFVCRSETNEYQTRGTVTTNTQF